MLITSGYVCRPAVIASHTATEHKLIVWDWPGATWSEALSAAASLRSAWPDYSLKATMVLFAAEGS